jgi:serpin B
MTPAARAMNRFALNLYAAVHPADNFAFSPASVYWALSMSLMGAAGATAEQLRSVLGIADLDALTAASTDSKEYKLAIANGVFADRSVELLSEFVAAIAASHQATCEALDFVKQSEKARTHINEWVATATERRIQDLLLPGTVAPDTRLILVNAVYFKAEWLHMFPDDTSDAPFTLSSGECVQVPMMRTTETLPVVFNTEASVLELPYKGGEMSMAIVLPAEGSSLEELEPALTAEVLTGWLSRLRAREMVIGMPRFTIDADAFSLVGSLASLGVTSLFDPGTCDLSNALCNKKVYVENILHKTYLSVTEEGTEAAAATAMLAVESKPPKRRFIANRPFLFLIRDLRDDSFLFMGRVTDPRS